MCGNGAGTFMEAIPVERRVIRMELTAVPTVCYVAVAGPAMPSTAPFRFGTTSMRPTGLTVWASASAGFSLDFFFFPFLLFASSEEKGRKLQTYDR